MKRILIYRVAAKQGPFVTPYFLTKKACQQQLKKIQNDDLTCRMFGPEFEIQMNELFIPEN